jgi:4'-phosphopantetheinyl transferase
VVVHPRVTPSSDGAEPRGARLAVAPETIDLWHGTLECTPGRLAACLSLLSPDERAREQRYLTAESRQRYLVARATLRRILAQYTGQPPETLRFTYQPQGKPLLDPPSLHFNLAHAADRVLIAVCRQDVGVDIEPMRTLDYTGMARTAWPAPEQAQLAQAQPANVADVFFRIWTRYEARAKAGGGGLLLPAPPIPVWDIDIGPGFRAAVAADMAVPRIVLREIEYD